MTAALAERQFISKANHATVTQRIYQCDNGLQLFARRGGPLHAADRHTWEIVTGDRGVPYGSPVGFVDDATLADVVDRLAAWPAS